KPEESDKNLKEPEKSSRTSERNQDVLEVTKVSSDKQEPEDNKETSNEDQDDSEEEEYISEEDTSKKDQE
ncbi:17376_t:CDS:1, partial [Dentiscutata heterogama]